MKKCADAGVDIVRLTVQGMTEARACEHIKRRLLEDGYTTPLVADIHFTPKALGFQQIFVQGCPGPSHTSQLRASACNRNPLSEALLFRGSSQFDRRPIDMPHILKTFLPTIAPKIIAPHHSMFSKYHVVGN